MSRKVPNASKSNTYWRFFVLIIGLIGQAVFNSTEAIEFNKTRLLEEISELSSNHMEGRKAPSPGYFQSQTYIATKFKEIGLVEFVPDYKQEFGYQTSWQDKAGVNLIGAITGSKYPDKYIVVTAHYDHLGAKGLRVFNGANDNASGVVAMFELARYLMAHQPKYSFIFVATDAEESNLYGATAFINSSLVLTEQILLNLNIDMIGFGGRKQRLYVLPKKSTKTIKNLIKQQNLKYTDVRFNLKLRKKVRSFASFARTDWTQASDHAAFAKAGINYVYFGAEESPTYHSVNDTADLIQADFWFYSISAIIGITEQIQELTLEQLVSIIN